MQPAKMGHTAHVCEVYSIFPVTQKYCQTHHPKKNRCGRKVDGGLEEGVFVVKVTPAAVCTVKVTPKGPLALGCSPPPGWGVGRAQPGRLGAGPPAQLPSLPPSSVFSHHPVPTFLSEHPPSFLGPGVLLGTSFSSRTLKGIAPAVVSTLLQGQLTPSHDVHWLCPESPTHPPFLHSVPRASH